MVSQLTDAPQRRDRSLGDSRLPASCGMLVLGRKAQEGFWIDGRIFVKVLGIGRRRVKLGIEAPSDLRILRDELGSRSAEEAPDERVFPFRNGRLEPRDPSG